MRMTQHGDALVQLTRLPRLFPVNCYLVREDDGWTLIDAALPGSAPAILAAAQSLGAPIVRIALTHAPAITLARSTRSTRRCRLPRSSSRRAKPGSWPAISASIRMSLR